MNPGGTASRITNGSLKEANCAIRIRYTRTIESNNPIAKLLNESCIATTEPCNCRRVFGGNLVWSMSLCTCLRQNTDILSLR